MTKEQIKALAEYFTGPSVVHNSIGLQVPSQNQYAKAFFNTRTALGISGYMDKDEALGILSSKTP